MAKLLCKGSSFISSGRSSSSFSSDRRNPFSHPISRLSVLPANNFLGRKLVFDCPKGKPADIILRSVPVKMSLSFPKAMRWWEKGIQPNMKEIDSAQELVNSLLESGDRLVIVDFFSPGCAGCRALHPKICQFAGKNPDVLFLQVNYEMHKSMCYSLNVHVLPFFRFYRGAHGRLCSFSCTNATIQKFKDALAKHTTERCSIWPAKGLEESELLALAANKDLCFDYSTNFEEVLFTSPETKEPVSAIQEFHLSPIPNSSMKESDDKVLTVSGR